MSWKDLFRPIKDIDPNDPKNKDISDKSRKAGEKTAKFLRLDVLTSKMQGYANKHPKRFLALAFGIPTLMILFNLVNTTRVIINPSSSAIDNQHKMMQAVHKVKQAPKPIQVGKPMTIGQAEMRVDQLVSKGDSMTYADSVEVKSHLERITSIQKKYAE